MDKTWEKKIAADNVDLTDLHRIEQEQKMVKDLLPGYKVCSTPSLLDACLQTELVGDDLDTMSGFFAEKDSLEAFPEEQYTEMSHMKSIDQRSHEIDEAYVVPDFIGVKFSQKTLILLKDSKRTTTVTFSPETLESDEIIVKVSEWPIGDLYLSVGGHEIFPHREPQLPHFISIQTECKKFSLEEAMLYGVDPQHAERERAAWRQREHRQRRISTQSEEDIATQSLRNDQSPELQLKHAASEKIRTSSRKSQKAVHVQTFVHIGPDALTEENSESVKSIIKQLSSRIDEKTSSEHHKSEVRSSQKTSGTYIGCQDSIENESESTMMDITDIKNTSPLSETGAVAESRPLSAGASITREGDPEVVESADENKTEISNQAKEYKVQLLENASFPKLFSENESENTMMGTTDQTNTTSLSATGAVADSKPHTAGSSITGEGVSEVVESVDERSGISKEEKEYKVQILEDASFPKLLSNDLTQEYVDTTNAGEINPFLGGLEVEREMGPLTSKLGELLTELRNIELETDIISESTNDHRDKRTSNDLEGHPVTTQPASSFAPSNNVPTEPYLVVTSPGDLGPPKAPLLERNPTATLIVTPSMSSVEPTPTGNTLAQSQAPSIARLPLSSQFFLSEGSQADVFQRYMSELEVAKSRMCTCPPGRCENRHLWERSICKSKLRDKRSTLAEVQEELARPYRPVRTQSTSPTTTMRTSMTVDPDDILHPPDSSETYNGKK